MKLKARRATVGLRKQVVLETENLIVRALAPQDIGPEFVAWHADPDVMKHLAHLPLNASRELIAAAAKTAIRFGGFYFGIFDRESNSPIGFILINRDRVNKRVSSSLALGDKSYWGTGVMNEARRAVIEFLFTKTDTQKIVSAVFSRNFAAIANNKALGFRLEGILKEHNRTDPAGPRDVCMFALLKQEWLEQQQAGAS